MALADSETVAQLKKFRHSVFISALAKIGSIPEKIFHFTLSSFRNTYLRITDITYLFARGLRYAYANAEAVLIYAFNAVSEIAVSLRDYTKSILKDFSGYFSSLI